MSWRRFLVVVPSALIVVLLLLAVATNVALGQGDRGGSTEFRASLIGYNETPSISTMAQGQFRARLVSPGMLQYELTFSTLEGGPATVAHIHLGQRHTAGSPSAFLCGGGGQASCPASGTVTGTITAATVVGPAAQGIAPGQFDELIRAMRAGATYANVHDATYPSGEIRGQIRSGDNPDRGDD